MKSNFKDEYEYINYINEMYASNNYADIVSVSSLIYSYMDKIDSFENDNTIYKICYSMFINKKYSELSFLVINLCQIGIEKYNYAFLCLASLIANNDIFMAKSYIQKIKLLNIKEVSSIIAKDETVYYNIINNVSAQNIPCFILLYFVMSIDTSCITNSKDSKNELMIRYFEMLDNIYSLTKQEKIVNYMNDIGNFIF